MHYIDLQYKKIYRSSNIQHNMIEAYVGISLLGLGYMLSQQQTGKVNQTKQINVNELNSQTNTYDSQFHRTTAAVDARKAAALYQRASEAPNMVVMKGGRQEPEYEYSMLAGAPIPKNEFRHNNMQPFHKRKDVIMDQIKHDDAYFQPMLETFTGTSQFQKPKSEAQPFFAPVQEDICSRYKVHTDMIQDRIIPSRMQNNELPFEQIRVGPALNRGYGHLPEGGFQQFDIRDYVLPKTVDELRTANNPKVTYEGRTVDGQKGSRPGLIGSMAKNRPEKTVETNHANCLKTTGANLKPAQRSTPIDKVTSRQETSKSYAGAASVAVKAATNRLNFQKSNRVETRGPEVGAANMIGKFSTRHDYGKASVQVYSNERDVTLTRTHQGNLTTVVKAMVAPLQDLLKVTKKEFFTEHGRTFGSLQPSFPAKQTVYDPNNVARTTIKETTLGPYDVHNLKGALKPTVYDPNDVARTTINQTTLASSQNLNLRGHKKAPAYDPNNVARTTMKETLLNESERLNLKGPQKSKAYDPNHVARTTLKETLLQDTDVINVSSARTAGVVYDPNMQAKSTVRETLDDIETNINLASQLRHGQAYDPKQVARTTIKEAFVDGARVFGGNPGTDTIHGGYEQLFDTLDAPYTQREDLQDEYSGNPNNPRGDAYKVTDAKPRDTQRQETSDNDYFGSARDNTLHAPTSYEDVYNATINSLKEETLIGREPTQSGTKVFSGADSLCTIQVRKPMCESIENRTTGNKDRIVNKMIDNKDITLTRNPQEYDNMTEQRLEDLIASAIHDNPFVIKPAFTKD